MASSNPVFSQVNREIKQGYAGFDQQRAGQQPGYNPAGMQGVQDRLTSDQLEQMYDAPPAGPIQTGRLTFDDVIMKTLGLFVLLVAAAAGSWFLSRGNPSPAHADVDRRRAGRLRRRPGDHLHEEDQRAARSSSTPCSQGAFLGAFSLVMEQRWPGIVMTAVVATLCTFVGMFLGYRFGLIKVTSRSRKIFGMMLIGYLLFSVVNVIGLMLGWTSGWGFGGSGLLGIGISLLGVGLASYSLAVDFDDIAERRSARVCRRSTRGCWPYGLIVTLVWLYIEMLRLLAILRGD